MLCYNIYFDSINAWDKCFVTIYCDGIDFPYDRTMPQQVTIQSREFSSFKFHWQPYLRKRSQSIGSFLRENTTQLK